MQIIFRRYNYYARARAAKYRDRYREDINANRMQNSRAAVARFGDSAPLKVPLRNDAPSNPWQRRYIHRKWAMRTVEVEERNWTSYARERVRAERAPQFVTDAFHIHLQICRAHCGIANIGFRPFEISFYSLLHARRRVSVLLLD